MKTKTDREKYLAFSEALDKLEDEIFSFVQETIGGRKREEIKNKYGVPIATQTRILKRDKYDPATKKAKYSITARKALDALDKITKTS